MWRPRCCSVTRLTCEFCRLATDGPTRAPPPAASPCRPSPPCPPAPLPARSDRRATAALVAAGEIFTVVNLAGVQRPLGAPEAEVVEQHDIWFLDWIADDGRSHYNVQFGSTVPDAFVRPPEPSGSFLVAPDAMRLNGFHVSSASHVALASRPHSRPRRCRAIPPPPPQMFLYRGAPPYSPTVLQFLAFSYKWISVATLPPSLLALRPQARQKM